MVNVNFLKRIMVVGERSQLHNLTRYMELATDATNILIEMLKTENGRKRNLNNKVRDLEKQADRLTITLKDQITSGAISSNLMDNLINLVETCDDLLDKSFFLSREIKRVDESTHKFDEWTKDFLSKGYKTCASILEKNLKALDEVKKLLEVKDFQEVSEIRSRIQLLEEQVDDLKDNMIDDLYNSSDNLPYILFIHLTELVHKLDDLLDDCEDIADLVHTINVAITR